MRQQFRTWLRLERHPWRASVISISMTALVWVVLAWQPYAVWTGLIATLLVISAALLFGLVPALFTIAITLLLTDPMLSIIARSIGLVSPLQAPRLLLWPTFVVGNLSTILVMHMLNRERAKSQAAAQLHNSTIAHISDAVVTTDVSGAIKYFNPAASALLQLDREHIGLNFSTVIDIRDEQHTGSGSSLVDEARLAGATLYPRTRQTLVRSDGSRVPIEAFAAPVYGESDAVVNVVLTIRDCSEQRRIETVLRERLSLQSRLERITSVMPGSLQEFRVFPDGRVSVHYASEAFKQIIGVDPVAYEGGAEPPFSLVHADDRARVTAAIQEALVDRKPLHIEHRFMNPQRGVVWASISMTPSYELQDCFVWHSVMIDITERKRAEERLRTFEMQLRTALQAGGMGVLELELASGRLSLDDSARRLWGLENIPAEQLNVEHLIARLHPEDLSAALAYHRELSSGPQPYEREYRLSMSDGAERWLLCKGLVYRGELSGQLTKVGIILDTTAHRHNTEQRIHSQKLAALGVLAGGIAHDFNNLLLAISGNVRLLLADMPAGDPMWASVREIDKAAARAADLVRRILSFSSVPEPDREILPLPLRPVLDEVLGLARAVLPATMTMTVQLAEQLPEVRADSGQLHQVLLNLLSNAADAAGAGKTIDVQVNVEVVQTEAELTVGAWRLAAGRYVRITVTDNGCGIEPNVLQRIFDPFFTTKPAGRGTGLGLAIIHGIMKNVGGAVTVSSTPGIGSSFAVYFQVADAPQPAPVLATEPPRSASQPAHILYVDDEDALVFLMSRTLERMGYKVTACSAPEQALAQFVAQPEAFDVVVSDMAMPGMSGLELAERMLAVRRDLPFIITSGYVDSADEQRAQAVGVQQMILKPNTVDELSATLLALVRRGGS